MMSRSALEGVVLVAAGCFTAVRAGAQTVQGTLLGEKSHALVRQAQVSLVDDIGHVVATTDVDTASGAFYLDAPGAGQYKLRILVGRGGLSYSPLFALDSNQTIERTFAIPDWPTAVLEAYLAAEVTRKAAALPGSRPPRFPIAMLSARRGGLVRARFVVMVDGRAEISSFEVVEADDASFSDAVRRFVDGVHFRPAERDGVAVPQVYDIAVDFGVADDPPRSEDKNLIIVRALGIVRRRTP